MNPRTSLAVLALATTMLFSGAAFAGEEKAKEYQVTGEVMEVTDTVVTIKTVKGDETWELEIGNGTQIEGKLKKGEKVTIHYRMLAKSIDKKEDAKKDKK